MEKKAPVKKGALGWYFNFNLLYRILIGLVIGAILGIILAANGVTALPAWVSMFGNIFMRLLKMIIIPIMMATLIVGASSVSPASLGKVGIRIVVLYLITSAFAVVIGLLMGAIFRPSAGLATLAANAAGKTASVSIWTTIAEIVPTSVATAIVNEKVLQVIFFTLVFGISLSYLKIAQDERLRNAGLVIYNFFDGVAEIMMRIVKGIMEYAPIGVFVLVMEVFAKNGAKVAGSLAVVTIACFLGYLIHVLLVYGGILRIGKIKGKTFFNAAKEPFLTAFVTRSSNGTLPVTMQGAESLGIQKDVYGFSLPLGATINMDGTAIYQGVCSIFIALSVGHGMYSFGQMCLIVVAATLASIGTAGVPGAGAIMLVMVMETVGLPIKEGTTIAGAYALILGIDAILDMGRTALNVTGDLTCTAFVAKKMGMLTDDSPIK
ncbi:MAG: dicarboxylate/amino acid:cation symporter [Sphaerochaetaceae bacterium]